ncbi:hypothetical protein BN1058_00892 [Paraliobacillus sp. PM-2]|nr:hypothetical protein [Paraliobacillus sp. PM-2]CQR46623.1 hypothetical protein BN1058_00892 [Paraliobacillus sp. PM-2]
MPFFGPRFVRPTPVYRRGFRRGFGTGFIPGYARGFRRGFRRRTFGPF